MPFDFDANFKDENAEVPEAPKTDAPVTETKTPEVPVAPVPEAKTPEAPKEHTVPLATFLDQRDEVNRLKEENARLRPSPEDPVIPDRVKDPEGYEAYRNEQFQQVVLNERLNNSEMFAIKEHGEELVKNVQAWALKRFEADPNFYRLITQNRHPYGAAIEAYNRDQLLDRFKDPKELVEFEELKKSKAGSPGAGGSPPAGSTSANTPVAPAAKDPPGKSPAPTSIVDEQSAKGGRTTGAAGPGQAFSQTFVGE